jgi:hypothetical protein
MFVSTVVLYVRYRRRPHPGHCGLPMAQPLLQLLKEEGERPDVLVADVMCGVRHGECQD